MITIDGTSIQRFLDRVKQAAKTGAKDIRITTAEATEIAATLAQILAAQMTVNTAHTTTSQSISLDGGSFGI